MSDDFLLSVDRALRLLLLYRHPQQRLKVSEIARLLDIHKSTASRLCAKLASQNFLERDEDAYCLGVSLARLGIQVALTRSLIVASGRVLASLAHSTGETANISQWDGECPLIVAQREGKEALDERNWIGTREYGHATATGKVFHAFVSGSDLPAAYPRVATRTVTSADRFEDELAIVRRRMFATSISELQDHHNVAAVPIFDPSGQCVAALDVSGPDHRFSVKDLTNLANGQLRLGARQIERELARRSREVSSESVAGTATSMAAPEIPPTFAM